MPTQNRWIVVVGESFFVRSTDGPDKPWFRNAKACGFGRLRIADNEFPIRFVEETPIDRGPIDVAYRSKYRDRPTYYVLRAAGSNATLQLIRQ